MTYTNNPMIVTESNPSAKGILSINQAMALASVMS